MWKLLFLKAVAIFYMLVYISCFFDYLESRPQPFERLLKTSPECSEVIAISEIMFGEAENQTLESKHALGHFLISEAIKNNRTLCEEAYYRKPGGALKYSSMINDFKTRRAKRSASYIQILDEAKEFWNTKRKDYEYMSKYNHYITLKLAKLNPPSWFKYYIVDYKIYGDHVFVNLDFKNKDTTRETGKYLNNYNTLIKEIDNKGLIF